MPALHAAVPLEQVHDVAVGVGQDLHLDVARIEYRLLEVHGRVAECGLRFAAGGLDRLGQRRRVGNSSHPAASAAGHRLDEQRELDPRSRSDSNQLVDRCRRRRGIQDRQPGGTGRLDRSRLVPGELQNLRARADERDARLGARRRQFRVLRQEAVSGIDRVGPAAERGGDDLVDRQVRPYRMSHLADLIRLVGFEAMLGVAVLVRIDRDGGDAELVGGAERADGDFAAIGNEDFVDH